MPTDSSDPVGSDLHQPDAAASTVLAEIAQVLGAVDAADIDALARRLAQANRVFVAGEGRSGLMAKAFAMRLMHLGLTVFVVGETISPPLRPGDTVVAVSGSGTTQATVRLANLACDAGAVVHAVTTDPHAALAERSAQVLVLPAATKFRRSGEAATIQPLSSLFDQVAHIVLDVVCLRLAATLGVDNAAAKAAHANTE